MLLLPLLLLHLLLHLLLALLLHLLLALLLLLLGALLLLLLRALLLLRLAALGRRNRSRCRRRGVTAALLLPWPVAACVLLSLTPLFGARDRRLCRRESWRS